MSTLERHTFDVLVIGAGGAGLRAAIEAREQGLRVPSLCKSPLLKKYLTEPEFAVLDNPQTSSAVAREKA